MKLVVLLIAFLVSSVCYAERIDVNGLLSFESPYDKYKSRVVDKPQFKFYAVDVVEKSIFRKVPLFSVELRSQDEVIRAIRESGGMNERWSDYIHSYFKGNFGNGSYRLVRTGGTSTPLGKLTIYIGAGAHNGGDRGSIYAAPLLIGDTEVVFYSLQGPIKKNDGMPENYPNFVEFLAFLNSVTLESHNKQLQPTANAPAE